ncbi:MAG: polysaccharide deacetylase family protein [Syntrophomonadaceae bacterium]|nr:polysaccharide deacetylase family protein [Syntrophomonadaceae bacterium]
MSPRNKLVVLIAFIIILFTPQLISGLHNYQRQQAADLIPETASPGGSVEIVAVQPPELIKTPVPPGQAISIPILMYHEIATGPDCLWVSTPDFYEQMKYLNDNGYQTITLSQAVELLSGHYDTSRKVVLTFDDGYDTFYTNAWPILQEFNQQATIFIISELVGKPGYMSWEQIKVLADNNIEIGGHTKTHPLLPTLTPAQSAEEISGAKQAMDTRLGLTTTMFCYPTGQYNREIEQQVKTAGYKAAVTMVQRRASSKDDLLLLPRWGIYKGDSLEQFAVLVK